MTEIKMRKRHRIRQKEIEQLAGQLESAFGTTVFGVNDTVDMAEVPDGDIVLVNGRVLAAVFDGAPFLTVRGLLKYNATKRFVTVDMGAVKFVANGADVMGPGIVDVDLDIAPGDIVWVRDERNKKPLAVGRALVSGAEMMGKPKGKTVKSLHHVGDAYWMLDEPKEEKTPASDQ